MDEDNLQDINSDVKVYECIDHDKKEWDLHSIASFLAFNVLADIKTIPIPTSSLEDRVCWDFSQDGRFSLKCATWAMRTLDPRF